MSKFEIYKGGDTGEQCWRWRLKDGSHKIARSEEPFLKTSIVGSIKTIKEKIDKNTPVYQDESKEDTDKGYRFEYFEGQNQQWYWRLKIGNHELLAIGGEGFSSKQSVQKSIDNIKSEIPKAEITWENHEDDPAYQHKKDDSTEPKGIPGS